IRRVDDDRAGLLRALEPIEDRPALAHREYIGGVSLECGVGGNQLHIEAARHQGLSDAVQNGAGVVDPPRRLRLLAINPPAGPLRVHAPSAIPRSRPNSAASAAAMSRARSMSNTRGRTMPRTGGCSATSQPR